MHLILAMCTPNPGKIPILSVPKNREHKKIYKIASEADEFAWMKVNENTLKSLWFGHM